MRDASVQAALFAPGAPELPDPARSSALCLSHGPMAWAPASSRYECRSCARHAGPAGSSDGVQWDFRYRTGAITGGVHPAAAPRTPGDPR